MFAPETGSSSSLPGPQPCRRFEFHEIQSATQNFDDSLIIGHGGFGKVYKGAIVDGGILVVTAIKRLDAVSDQGADEFWAEVEMLSKLRHCHLVSLIGYCNEGKEMILVYEYMPRGTLEDHLHKLPTSLSWVQRLKICIGAARGLHYLHTGTGIELGVIHRDVKSSNILLHDSWAAKISDFGLSKIGPVNQPSTYVKTLVKGTFGYLDPDYFQTGRLTRKSDVYAFGVVLFEVLCRKRAVDKSLDKEQWGLARWAQDSIKEGSLKHIVDPSLRGQIFPKCLKDFAQTADRCLHSHPKQRPTMAEVVVSLESVLALQEKTDNSSQPAGTTIFGRMALMLPFPFKANSSAPSGTLVRGSDVEFSYEELAKATDDFSLDNKIGQGGFGTVYFAELRGEKAAIKKTSMQASRQLLTELKAFSRVHHRNLVRLIGYCVKGSLFLVYDYIENGNLSQHLHGSGRSPLPWSTRVQIAIDIAKGLEYIHEATVRPIIHRDIKSANILIDKNFLAKVADFGLTKAIEVGSTSMAAPLVGTLGYMPPEYFQYGDVSPKVDVYAFGVVLYELVSAKEAIVNANGSVADSKSLIALFEEVLSLPDPKYHLHKIVDRRLGDNYPLDSVFMMVQLAKACTHENPQLRPRMGLVVTALMTLSSSAEDWDAGSFL